MKPVRHIPPHPHRHAEGLSRQARRFFLLAFCSITTAMCLSWTLSERFGRVVSLVPVLFPPAFAASSILLLLGSFAMHQAIVFVKQEKQGPFRNWLFNSLILGTLFMGVQSYGLWSMFPVERSADEASRGVTAFVMCLTTLHGLHFLVATLFVAFVLTRSWEDRYDHEYFLGVRVCAWFWHVLGIVWLAILAVIAIAFQAG